MKTTLMVSAAILLSFGIAGSAMAGPNTNGQGNDNRSEKAQNPGCSPGEAANFFAGIEGYSVGQARQMIVDAELGTNPEISQALKEFCDAYVPD